MASDRYARLRPYSVDEKHLFSVFLLNFFQFKSQDDYKKKCELLGKPFENNVSRPFSIMEFMRWFNLTQKEVFAERDIFKDIYHLPKLAVALEQAGFLEAVGGDSLNRHYRTNLERSDTAGKGSLFLGQALGADFLASRIANVLVRIEGTTSLGDRSIGTGTVIADKYVLTCRHVVSDMKVDSQVYIGGVAYEIHEILEPRGQSDVAFIKLAQAPELLPDLAFRPAELLEPILVAGFPPVPRGTVSPPTYQTGEICGRISETFDGQPYELFSCIVRPGNSGGPIVSMDGRIIGIVTRTLERSSEQNDKLQTMPFFASVPSDEIRKAAATIIPEFAFPWEDYS